MKNLKIFLAVLFLYSCKSNEGNQNGCEKEGFKNETVITKIYAGDNLTTTLSQFYDEKGNLIKENEKSQTYSSEKKYVYDNESKLISVSYSNGMREIHNHRGNNKEIIVLNKKGDTTLKTKEYFDSKGRISKRVVESYDSSFDIPVVTNVYEYKKH